MSSESLSAAAADPAAVSPCLTCGACCATYRVSFYWAEAEAHGLDASWTEVLNPWLACMRGTSQAQPRCSALAGRLGMQVQCRVYPARPQVCREVAAGSEQCQKARLRHGLGMLALPFPAADPLP